MEIDGDDEANGDNGDDEKAEEKKPGKKGKGGDKAEKDAKAEPLVIDFDGLGDRVMRIPVGPDNYNGLVAIKGHLLYGTNGPPFYGRFNRDASKLHIYSFDKD